MTRAVARHVKNPAPASKPLAEVARFERELTELLRKYGLAITGSMNLFIREPDDFERKYSTDEESRLQFV